MSVFADFFSKDKIIIELEHLEINNNEREELLKTIDEIAELRIIDAILEKLEVRDKELFLKQLHGGAAEIVAEILREKIENLEEVLRERAKLVEKEILEDIRHLRRKS